MEGAGAVFDGARKRGVTNKWLAGSARATVWRGYWGWGEERRRSGGAKTVHEEAQYN